MHISMDSEEFKALAQIANHRSTKNKMNLAQIGFTLQLAHVLGVSVSGLEQINAQILEANPRFSGWELIDLDEYCKDLKFMDECQIDPSRSFEAEFLEEVEAGKQYLNTIKAMP